MRRDISVGQARKLALLGGMDGFLRRAVRIGGARFHFDKAKYFGLALPVPRDAIDFAAQRIACTPVARDDFVTFGLQKQRGHILTGLAALFRI